MTGDNGKGKQTEWYRRHRPSLWKHVVGQDRAVKLLEGYVERGEVPHTLLLCGSSGTGKTTLARILAKKMGCVGPDFQEVNCGLVDPMDAVKGINLRMHLMPFTSPCRVWMLEESQSLSRASFAQQALLKVLEEAPQHAYFFLTTTEPAKLHKAVRGRCSKVTLEALKDADVTRSVQNVLGREGKELSDAVLRRIADCSEGSARMAIQLAQKAAAHATEEEQLGAVVREEDLAWKLVKALLWGDRKPKWADLAALIKEVPEGEDWEQMRYLLMSCASKILLDGGKGMPKAGELLNQLVDPPWIYMGRNGLINVCWQMFQGAGGGRR